MKANIPVRRERVSNLISDEIIEKRLFAGRYVKRYRVITYKSKIGIMSKWIKIEEEENNE